jgi:hypothetical protein
MLQPSRWRDKRLTRNRTWGDKLPAESNDAGPSRRAFLARFAGAAFAVPVIASFALDGVAQASERNYHHQGNPNQTSGNQGHPKQCHPNQSNPNQTTGNQGHPKHGYPNQTSGNQGYPNHGHPKQCHPNQTNPNQTLPDSAVV